jgi:hypothetical protein
MLWAGQCPLQDRLGHPYGSHQFGLRDPEDNLWTIGTYRPRSARASRRSATIGGATPTDDLRAPPDIVAGVRGTVVPARAA